MTKEQAKAILGDMVQGDGSLYFNQIDKNHLRWDSRLVYIDGYFTPDTLEALAFWMRNVKVTV